MPSCGLRVIVGVNEQHATLIGWDRYFVKVFMPTLRGTRMSQSDCRSHSCDRGDPRTERGPTNRP